MKKGLRLALVLAMAFSCQTEQDNQQATRVDPAVSRTGEQDDLFYGSIESFPDTKVYADANLNVLWNADDRITIFRKEAAAREYRFLGEDGANAGAFEEVMHEGVEPGASLPYNYAVYPYSPETVISGEGVLTVSFPEEQVYRESSFGVGANLMVSVTEDNFLRFKNAGTYLSFRLYGSDIAVSQISFRGNKGEKIAGGATLQMALNGEPSVTMTEDAAETVTLVCSSPVPLSASSEDNVEFWIVLPPITFEEGFTVTVTDSEGNRYEKSSTKSFELKRKTLLRMKAFEIVPLGFGFYRSTEEDFVYDQTTDQMNIYEAEGSVWFRFLRLPSLTMYELGPIPADAAVGDTFTATMSVVEGGVTTGSAEYELTVRSYRNGVMNLVTAAEDRFVIRF